MNAVLKMYMLDCAFILITLEKYIKLSIGAINGAVVWTDQYGRSRWKRARPQFCLSVRKQKKKNSNWNWIHLSARQTLFLLSWRAVQGVSFQEAILETGRCVFGIQTRRQHSCCGSGDRSSHLWSENLKEMGTKIDFKSEPSLCRT